MVADCVGTCCVCDDFGGVTVRAGWVLIVAGVSSAVIFRHADSIVWGIFMVAFGVWMLTVKEPVR